MKKITLLMLLSVILFGSCKKKTSDVSNIVNVTYPVITLNGDAFVSTPVGSGAYVDPGATGKNDISGATSSLSPIDNTVDLTKPGFYTVVYQMKNDNGFISRATRFVLVTGVSASKDFGGLYQRSGAANRPANLAKLGTGLYKIDNVGGVILPDQAPAYSAYLGFVSDSTIEIPLQTADDGTALEGADGKFYIDSSAGPPFDTIMQWKMSVGPFLHTNDRIFYKAH